MDKAIARRKREKEGTSSGSNGTEIGSDGSIQATANDAASGKLAAATLGYFRDPYVEHFAAGAFGDGCSRNTGHHKGASIDVPSFARRLPPVINRGNFARVSCIEKLVLEFLSPAVSSSPSTSGRDGVDAGEARASTATDPATQARDANAATPSNAPETAGGVCPGTTRASRRRNPQVISLGAGKDSLYFRLKEAGRAPLGGYFEVDFEAVASWKARLISGTPALSSLTGDETSPSPGCYRLVSGDLRDIPKLEAGLRAAGVDISAPTVFLAECVLVYMEPNESAALLKWCSSTFPDALFAAYEMTKPNDAFGKMMRQNIQRMGCLLPGLEPYPNLKTQQERFLAAGWDSARASDMLHIYQCFLDREEVRRASKIEVLDEVEEWELIMRHYCIVVGAKGRDAELLLEQLSLGPREPSS